MSDLDVVERIEFTVQGLPIPQGSKSLFRGRLVDANAGLKAWRKAVKAAAVVAMAGRPPIDEPTVFITDFYLPRGKTVRRARPSVRPDLDKLVRAIGDSLTDAKVWTEDSRAVSIRSDKWYADDKPYVTVKVRRLA